MSIRKFKLKSLLKRYKDDEIELSEMNEMLDLTSKNERVVHKFLEKDWKENYHRQLKSTKNKYEVFPIWKLCAGLILLVTVIFSVRIWLQMTSSTYYKTAYGETMSIELSDGSLVKLNANSSLKWEKQNEEQRVVELEGEAFFDIEKQADGQSLKPFIVKTSNYEIAVLGTRFNASSRDDFNKVYLEEGRIQLHTKTGSLFMKPGEVVEIDTNGAFIQHTGIDVVSGHTAWTKGVLQFKNETLAHVLSELQAIYGKQLLCKDEDLLKRKIDLGVPYSSEWEITKKALEMALNVDFIERNNTLEVVVSSNRE